jgi:hypothetical protein
VSHRASVKRKIVWCFIVLIRNQLFFCTQVFGRLQSRGEVEDRHG